MVNVGGTDYPNDCMDTNKINKKVRDELSKLCKKMKITKGILVEEFYKLILIRFKDGSLNATNGYLTMNILRSPIKK